MTKEEAIKILKTKINTMEDGAICCNYGNDKEVFDMAIKALGQESCEDAVSRTEIQQKINRLWNSNGDKNYCMETLKDFVTELQLVTPTQRWIPCSDRFPKESGFYLVSTTDCITIMEFIGGEWISQNIGSCNWYVKAWMPLPEPYKAERKESE